MVGWLPMPFETLAHELRVALRSWSRAPGVAVTAILTLALGIGASTALFTLVHGILIRPLPYRDADRLVVVRAEQDYEGASRPVPVQLSSDAVASWPKASRAFASLAFFSEGVGALSLPTGSEVVNTAIVDGPFFEMLDGPLLVGRGLSPADGADPVAVISARLWRRHFAGAPDVLGRTITVSGQLLTVVGVTADAFQWPRPTDDVWLTAGAARLANPRCCGFTPLGRLAADVSRAVADAEVSAIVGALGTQMPRALAGTRARVVPLADTLVSAVRPALLALAGAVALLMVLAVGNVASLLLARQVARAHETGVRRALGASRGRLVREALAECAWLSLAGGILGIALAWAGVEGLRSIAADALPRLDAVDVDGGTLAFAIGLASAVTLAVGALPSLFEHRQQARLRERARGFTASPRARLALGTITAGQLAISVLLLVVAALLGRSLVALLRTDMGIAPEHVATASINLAMDRTLTAQQQTDLVARVIERVSASPGVAVAGVGTSRPPDVSRVRLTLTRDGDGRDRASYQAAAVPVTPGYFAALGVRLERGRIFTEADRADAASVVILSASTARRLFPGRDAVGQRIGLPVVRDDKAAREDMTIVGIVGDVKFNGLDQQADDAVYRPFAQQPWPSAFLVARTSGDPDALAAQLRAEIATVDRSIAVSDLSSMDAVLSTVTAGPRLRSLVLAAFAAFAILIAAVGLHGVVAYSVSQRGPEMGVRMALGADARRIRLMVLGEGARLAVAGGALGMIGALGAARALSGLLYGVSTADWVSFAAATLGMMTAALAASYLPASRASRTDPAEVLRGD